MRHATTLVTVSFALVGIACAAARKPELTEPVGVSTVTSGPVDVPRQTGQRGDDPARPDVRAQRIESRCPAALPSFGFETDSDIVSAAQDDELRRLAACLTTAPYLRDATIIAVGHTDVVGSELYNLRLGLERASRVTAFLVSHGVPEDRLLATSAGDLPQEQTSSGRTGRRVDLFVVAGGRATTPPPVL
jgi:outer membrane protein OmpA-like peptidoglycan-associated protein